MSINYYQVMIRKKSIITNPQARPENAKKPKDSLRKLPLDLPHGNLNKANIFYMFSLLMGASHAYTLTYSLTHIHTH